jgi:hypothetical protein
MDTATRPDRLKVIVLFQLAIGLVLMPAANTLFYFSGRHPWAHDSTHAMPTLVFAGVAVLVTYGGAWAAAYRIEAEARRQGARESQARHDALVMFASIGGFLAVYGFSATETAGWGWGAAGYGVYLLYWADVCRRWRGYREALGEEEGASARGDSVR